MQLSAHTGAMRRAISKTAVPVHHTLDLVVIVRTRHLPEELKHHVVGGVTPVDRYGSWVDCCYFLLQWHMLVARCSLLESQSQSSPGRGWDSKSPPAARSVPAAVTGDDKAVLYVFIAIAQGKNE